ncbi:Protein of uncharacterised function (DUF551) [Raoultella terrigena]|uniref:Protein of uncharacterized function (DUF551) n=1 Tax=Raoultella terrigena TaxID=577 RepID=A0A7Z9CRK3_RAOTE|nr:Protein of uncharacterised function (DUF551) [Raoultella terrigena]
MTSKLTRLTDEELAELAFYAGESTCHPDPNYQLGFESLATGSSVLSIVRELQERRKAAMDSEPVALQPELEKVIYHFRDWNEGFPVERFKADYVISWMLANYPPAQPAPVVSADLLHTAASAIEDLLTTKDRTGAGVWFDLPFRLRSAANAQPAPVVPENSDPRDAFEAVFPMPKHAQRCGDGYAVTSYGAWTAYEFVKKWEGWNACRSAMLQDSQKSAGASNNCRSRENVQVMQDVSRCSTKAAPVLDSSPKTAESRCSKSPMWIGVDWAKGFEPGNSPVIPAGYVMVPREPTDEMIAAAMNCDDVLFNSDESFCVQFGNIYKAMLAAAPQPQNEPQNIPEIIPQWIPVSERMPERGDYLVTDGSDFDVQTFDGEQFIPGFVWEDKITHWMPLPAAPQEVKGEHRIRDEMDMGARITSHRFKV